MRIRFTHSGYFAFEGIQVCAEKGIFCDIHLLKIRDDKRSELRGDERDLQALM